MGVILLIMVGRGGGGSFCEPIFYKRLFSDEFRTEKQILGPEPVTIGKTFEQNVPEVKYTPNYCRSFCFGSLGYYLADVGDVYAEE